MRLLFWRRSEEKIIRDQLRAAFARCAKNGAELQLKESSADHFFATAEMTALYHGLLNDSAFSQLCRSIGVDSSRIIEEEYFNAKRG